jgi:hypothetical protein
MTPVQTLLRAGIATVAAIGFCGVAAAQSPQTHILTIALPGGGIEQIRYAGPVAPQVSLGHAPLMISMPTLLDPGAPFADLERISAAMDRQAARLFQEAAALSAQPDGAVPINVAAFRGLPAGSQEYSFVSMMNGNSVCSRSVEITAEGNGAAPHVVTHTSGNCSAGMAPGFGAPTQTQLPAAPAPANGPRLIMTKASTPHPESARIEEAALR